MTIAAGIAALVFPLAGGCAFPAMLLGVVSYSQMAIVR